MYLQFQQDEGLTLLELLIVIALAAIIAAIALPIFFTIISDAQVRADAASDRERAAFSMSWESAGYTIAHENGYMVAKGADGRIVAKIADKSGDSLNSVVTTFGNATYHPVATDGATIVGTIETGSTVQAFAYNINTKTTTTLPGLPGGTEVAAFDVDGNYIVGSAADANHLPHAVVWNLATGGYTELSHLPGESYSQAVSISGDTVMSHSFAGGGWHVVTSSVTGGAVADIGMLAGATSMDWIGGIDGNTLVGAAETGPDTIQPYSYDLTTGTFTLLGFPSGSTSVILTGVSGGNASGYANISGRPQALVYNLASGTITLLNSPQPGAMTDTLGISGDTVIGNALDGQTWQSSAVTWSVASGAMTPVALPVGADSSAGIAVGSGSLVVGQAGTNGSLETNFYYRK